MRGLDLRHFKKVATDQKSSTFKNNKGAEIKIAHAGLSKSHLNQLKALPLHSEEGNIVPENNVEAVDKSSLQGLVNDPEGSATQVLPGSPQIVFAQDKSNPQGLSEIPEQSPAPEQAGSLPQVSNAVSNAVIPPQESAKKLSATDIPGVSQEIKGINQLAQAQQQQSQYLANAERAHRQALEIAAAEWQNNSKGMEEDIHNALKDVQKGHIKPNQYLENMGTGSKIASAIGLFLGGLGSAYTGQGNPAMDFLNKQIDRDIDSQKSGLNNKMNVYHGYLEKYKNASVAEQMTRATQYALYASQAKEIMDKFQGPAAEAQKNLMLGKLFQSAQGAVANANLLRATAKFDSPDSQGGTEADYLSAMNAAQNINPAKHKDMQSKLMPGIGTTQIPVTHEDIASMASLRNLNELAKQGQALAQTEGRTMWGTAANQKANDIANSMRLQLGKLLELNRINEYEAKKYDDMIKSPGAWNSGAAIQSFKDIRNEIASKTQSLGDKVRLKPFRRLGQ